MAFATGTHGDGVVISPRATGDKGFAAVDDVVTAIPYRTGPQTGHIGAAAGLGHRQGCNFLTTQNRRHNLLTHLFSGPFGDRGHTDVERTQAGDQAAGSGAHQLLGNRDFQENIAFTDTAEAVREAYAQQTGISGFTVKLPWKPSGFFPLVDVGKHVSFNKLAGCQAYLFMGFVEVIRHGKASCILVYGALSVAQLRAPSKRLVLAAITKKPAQGRLRIRVLVRCRGGRYSSLQRPCPAATGLPDAGRTGHW